MAAMARRQCGALGGSSAVSSSGNAISSTRGSAAAAAAGATDASTRLPAMVLRRAVGRVPRVAMDR
eukprot:296993-Chlamydomonas_euryale.AAC.1